MRVFSSIQHDIAVCGVFLGRSFGVSEIVCYYYATLV